MTWSFKYNKVLWENNPFVHEMHPFTLNLPSMPWTYPLIVISGLTGDEFRFNKDNGDGPARYNIIHYKQVSIGKYEWITVGEFHHDVIQGDVMHLNMSGT